MEVAAVQACVFIINVEGAWALMVGAVVRLIALAPVPFPD
jgi:hypothetical protein